MSEHPNMCPPTTTHFRLTTLQRMSAPTLCHPGATSFGTWQPDDECRIRRLSSFHSGVPVNSYIVVT
ncbi:hypothetical protein K443DRAFT_6505 [Laccaria amethystina LaAM-08-1]|uniref:Uncharacterized protein n=1 Tax=Laccaria amethystina LaAM-08-1 TaxID=1095629 RepID=A0A0C9XWK7_9AGAR|nr:hypothetical protein K443DRAFT_6505 [Laccaria amethystina LaAM-08-1]